MEPDSPISERNAPKKSRRKPPVRLTSGVCTKPLSEGICDPEASAAAAEILSIVRRKGSKAELESAFERYEGILRRVAEGYPDEDLLEVERHSIPPSILNQPVCVPGLPKCTVPVSFLGWQNPELESALDRLAPQNGVRTGYARLIARILDRYVQSSFPVEGVGEFYRHSVLTLHTIIGHAGLYEDTAVALAKQLAQTLPLSDTENNPLKTPVHKSIPKETGVHLSEKNPSSQRRIIGRAHGGFGKRHIGPSVAGGMGLLADTRNIHPLLGARLGIPGCDEALRMRAIRDLPKKGELTECLSVVVRTGRPETYAHPALSGMEFSGDTCRTAVLIAFAAQSKLAGDDSAFPALLPGESRPAKALSQLPEYRMACETKDRARQMSIALEACALEARAMDISVRFGITDSYSQAAKDIETARSYVEEYNSPPENPSMVLRGVRKMQELARTAECQDSPAFELALLAIDERHKKSEPLATIKPPEGAAPPATEFSIPKPAPLPKDLAAGEEIAAPEPEAAAAGDSGGLPLSGLEQESADGVGVPASEAADNADMLKAALAYAASPQPAPQDAVALAEPAHEAPAQAGPAPQEAAPAKQDAGLPVFDFPFPNSVMDAALEPLLPPKTDKRNALIRKVSRALVSYINYRYDDVNIDTRCLEAVQSLKASYSQAAIVAFATAIVDGTPLPAIAPARVAPTIIDVDETGSQVYASNWQAPSAAPAPVAAPPALILTQLENHEKELVAAVMAVQGCDVDTLTRFIALAPARRELLVEGHIASIWTEGDFRTDISRMRRAKETLYQACGLSAPGASEKLSEISDPSNLLSSQRGVLVRLFNVAEQHLTSKHVEAFAVWVSSDPSFDSGRERLAKYWNEELVANKPKGFNISSGLWLNPSLEERRRFHHAHSFDPVSVGQLVHRLRFGDSTRLPIEETMAVCHLYGKSWAEASTLQDQAKENLALGLSHHVFDVSSATQLGTYYPEQFAAAKAFAMDSVGLVKKAARNEAEFKIMLDFLGFDADNARGTLLHTHGSSRAKRYKGAAKPNDDSWSSCVISMPSGPDISLDMVADGMGGHNQGGNGGRTNGQVASGTAKDVFDIAAIAGWIRGPEDVRKVILIADQAIVAEQLRKKAEWLAKNTVEKRWADSGVTDIQNMHPEWVSEFEKQVRDELISALHSIDARQANNMGTTMTVAFQRGSQLWFIHCGDSDGKVIRDGRILFATEGHSMEYQMRLSVKETAGEQVTGEYAARGIAAGALQGDALAEYEAKVEAEFESRVAPLADYFKRNGNVVSSVLGVKPVHVKINNLDSGYMPIETGLFDIIEVSSDGKSVPVCDHETPIVAFMRCMGNLDAARTSLVELAASRPTQNDPATKEPVPYLGLLCQCHERIGKTDDITLILRHAEEGMTKRRREFFSGGDFFWLTSRMTDSPSELALSRSLRLIIEGAADPATSQADVLRLFEAVIRNAERSPPSTSRETYSFALSLVSAITAMRHDRDEIVEALAPTLGSWSGLMLKKLRECPDASPRRRVMFDIAAMSVPSGELQPLLRSANPEIAEWAGACLGMAPETGAPVQAPRPIFNSQTGARGEPLDMWSTRYLDMPVLEIHGSSVVQDTARKLGVLPRDLEVMVFYAYADYAPEASLNPHETEGGDDLIASVGMHLCTGDAENILKASSMLWRLREWTPESPAECKRLAKELWDAVDSMNQDTPYAFMFHSKAFQFRGLLP